MQEVIFDSSFLMAVSDKPTSWFDDITMAIGKFEPVMLECIAAELSHLGEGVGKKGSLARVALEISKGFARRACGAAKADDEIMSAAIKTGAAVATADGALIRTLRGAHVRVVELRGGRAFVT